MNKAYAGIDLISCVQGNTVRKMDLFGSHNGADAVYDRCVVYNFRRGPESGTEVMRRTEREAGADRSEIGSETRSEIRRAKNRRAARKRAARNRARKVQLLRTFLAVFLLMSVFFGIGGIASKAESREVPEAYKYYDTITVAYQENLLDIVLRYDDRNYYETQQDYLEELCRINNLEYDGATYPVVTPGTHLIVPYYSAELK